MNRIIVILMKRDGMTQREAENYLEEVEDMINDTDDIKEKEDIFMSELGLELDYMMDLWT